MLCNCCSSFSPYFTHIRAGAISKMWSAAGSAVGRSSPPSFPKSLELATNAKSPGFGFNAIDFPFASNLFFISCSQFLTSIHCCKQCHHLIRCLNLLLHLIIVVYATTAMKVAMKLTRQLNRSVARPGLATKELHTRWPPPASTDVKLTQIKVRHCTQHWDERKIEN